jgi:hypothetical protein
VLGFTPTLGQSRVATAPQPEKHTPSKQVDQKYETWIIDMESSKPNSLEKKMGHNPP